MSTAKLLPMFFVNLVWSQSASELYKQINPSVVFIETDRGGGSGFCIGSGGLIATSLRVVDGAESVSIAFRSGFATSSVDLLASDPKTDLAILRSKGATCAIVPLGDSDSIQPGQRIYVIGNPLGRRDLAGSISDGLVSGLRSLEGKQKVIQISAPLSPGNSGGPVLTSDGKAVGIVAFKITSGELLNFAVPTEELRRLSSSIGKSPTPLHSWEPTKPSRYNSEAFHLDDNASVIFRRAALVTGTCGLEDASWEEFVTVNGKVSTRKRIEKREFGSLEIRTVQDASGKSAEVIRGRNPRGEWTKVNGRVTKRDELKEDDIISHLVNDWYCFCPGTVSLWRDVQVSKGSVDGADVWQVRVKEPFWGASLTFSFEVGSGRLVQRSYPMKGTGTPRIITDTFSEFRRVSGTAFTIPFKTVKTSSEGTRSVTEMITLTANAGYPDYFFDP